MIYLYEDVLISFCSHPLVLLVTGGCSDGNFSVATILNSTVKLALQLIELYTGLPSFPEIFTPISINIQRCTVLIVTECQKCYHQWIKMWHASNLVMWDFC